MADDGSDNSGDSGTSSSGDPRGAETPGGYSGTSESYGGYGGDSTTSADPGNSSPGYTSTPSDIGNSYSSPALADTGYYGGVDIGGQVSPAEAAPISTPIDNSAPSGAATIPSDITPFTPVDGLPTFAKNIPSAQYDVLSPPASDQSHVYSMLTQLDAFKSGDIANQPSNPNAVYDTLPIFAQQNLSVNLTSTGNLPPNTADMVQRLMALGATPAGAAGFTGQMTTESGFGLDPHVVNPNGVYSAQYGIQHAYGIAQDLYGRLAMLQSTPDYQNYDVQANQVINELQTSENAAYTKLINAQTVPQGVQAGFAFERPSTAEQQGATLKALQNGSTILGQITQNVSTAGFTAPATPTDTASGLYGDAVSYEQGVSALNLGDAGSVAFTGSALSDAAVQGGGLDTTIVAPTQVAGIRIPHIPSPEPPTVGQGPAPNVSTTGGFAGNIGIPSPTGAFGFDPTNLPYSMAVPSGPAPTPAPASSNPDTVTTTITAIPSLIGHGISTGIEIGRTAIPSISPGGAIGMAIGVPGAYNPPSRGSNVSGSPLLPIPVPYNRILPMSAIVPPTLPSEPVSRGVAPSVSQTMQHTPFAALAKLFGSFRSAML